MALSKKTEHRRKLGFCEAGTQKEQSSAGLVRSSCHIMLSQCCFKASPWIWSLDILMSFAPAILASSYSQKLLLAKKYLGGSPAFSVPWRAAGSCAGLHKVAGGTFSALLA